MELEPLADKWRSFGWHVIEVDGHDIAALQNAFAEAAATKDKPTCIIAHTIKGKGVSFMENNPKFHGTAPTREECAQGAAGACIMPAKTKYELKLGAGHARGFRQGAGGAGPRRTRTWWCWTPIFRNPPTPPSFAKEFPDRFFECGIAEANMVAIGAGLASAGKIPFASSFSVFAAEQGIRAVARHRGVSQRESESGRHAQRHLHRRRRPVADEHRGSEPGLLAAPDSR